MKKLLVIVLCLFCMGCSSDSEPKKIKVKMEKEYQEEKFNMTMENIHLTPEILPLNTNEDDYYYRYPLKDSDSFLDIELWIENTSKETIDLEDLMEIIPTSKESTFLYTLYKEEDNFTNVVEKTTLKKEEKTLFHLAITVPQKNETEKINCEIKTENNIYTINTERYKNINDIEYGDTVTYKDVFQLEILSLYPDIELYPTDYENAELYYPLEDENNGYIIMESNLTNLTNEDKLVYELAQCNVIFEREKNPMWITIETENGRSFEDGEIIPAGQTKKVYYFLELPRDIITKTCTIEIGAGLKKYYIDKMNIGDILNSIDEMD